MGTRGRGAGLATAGACVLLAGASSGTSAVSPYPDADIISIRPDGSGRSNLTPTPVQEAFPSVSPDGRRLAFVRSSFDSTAGSQEIGYVMSSRGGAARTLGPAHADVRNPFQRGPTWSPDGKLALTYFDSSTCRGRSTKCATPEVRIASADGPSETLLRGAADPAWSPRGDRVAVEGDWAIGEPRAIEIVSIDDRATTKLPLAGANPTWSGDGRFLAFDRDESTPGSEAGMVRITDLRGRTLRVLRAASEAVFAPRGRSLAFVRADQRRPNVDPVPSVQVVTAPAGGTRRLGRGTSVAWSPDGRRLAFVRSSARSSELYVVGVDGKGLRRVVRERTQIFGCPAWGANGRIYYALIRR